ncbi:MAG: hypothetical protein ABSB76_36675, partial [Streptosporangiaceae bacterium]
MTRTSTQDMQEEFLTALRKGQQTMIGALRIWVETVQTVTPKLAGVYAPITDRLPKLSAGSVPFADKLPSPKEAVDGAYGLAEELLANQRKFAEDVLDTAAPLLPGHGQDLKLAANPKTPMKPVVVRTEPRPAGPKPAAAVIPAPAQPVVMPEPKPVVPRPHAAVAMPEPKAPHAVAKPKFKAPVAAPPVAKSPEPNPPAPKAAAPKAA